MLSLDIPEIDFDKTRSNVIKYIDEYNYLAAIVPMRSEPQITQAFSFIPPATNRTLNTVEQSASKNIKRQQLFEKRKRLMDAMHEAVDTLPPDEKYIIVKNYLNNEKTIDIYNDLYISKTKFHEIKNRAIVHLAFALGIEVYEE
ncbi:ArpU family phage packaging/lysis transcriptional regulator [Jeotgalicoccus halotolerans]|uniref:ArpU family phage packaging/lysis transcriptional regulator n=1 Tax=Jeotgalicoccus halotolerans TaxID=157227 RepID=UPI0035144CF7